MKNPYPKTIDDNCTDQVFEDDRHRAWNEGVKEVVEWLENNNAEVVLNRPSWQAKLKEWGINEQSKKI